MSVLPDSNAAPDDGLVLLSNDAMRARRRPGVVLALWAWETLLAALFAWPTAGIVRGAYGDHPRGDAPLWNAGGRELIDLVLNTQHAGPTVGSLALAILAVAAVLGLFPLAGALVGIAYTTRDLRAPRIHDVAVRALRAFSPLVIVLLAASVLQIIVLILGVVFGASFGAALEPTLGEARSEQFGWLVTLAFVGVAAFIGVAQDLSRAAIVRFRVRAVPGMRLGLNALRRAPMTTFWSWAWRAAAGLAPVIMGSLVAERLGGRGGAALVALFAIHQLVVGVRVALHASWLAKAVRAVDHAHRVVRATQEEAEAAA